MQKPVLDYGRYDPKLAPLERLEAMSIILDKSAQKVAESGVLLKLGWVGAIIQAIVTIIALAANIALWWYGQEIARRKYELDKQAYEQALDEQGSDDTDDQVVAWQYITDHEPHG